MHLRLCYIETFILVPVSMPSYPTRSVLANCVTEQDTDYDGGNVNNGNIEPDVDSCRSLCHSISAPFYTYNPSYTTSCWCKSTNAGRAARVGVVSGDTACKNFKVRCDFSKRKGPLCCVLHVELEATVNLMATRLLSNLRPLSTSRLL